MARIVGLVAAFQDITAASRQKQHCVSENKQRMILDNAAEVVFAAGADERWTYVNDLV